jgi:hypothetical protein
MGDAIQRIKGIVFVSVFTTIGVAANALAAPDEVKLGKREGYPIAQIGNNKNWYFDESVRVGSFTRQAEIPRLLNGKTRSASRSSSIPTSSSSSCRPARTRRPKPRIHRSRASGMRSGAA